MKLLNLFGHLMIFRKQVVAQPKLQIMPREDTQLQALIDAVGKQIDKQDVKEAGFKLKRKYDVSGKVGVSMNALVDNVGLSGNSYNYEEISIRIKK